MLSSGRFRTPTGSKALSKETSRSTISHSGKPVVLLPESRFQIISTFCRTSFRAYPECDFGVPPSSGILYSDGTLCGSKYSAPKSVPARFLTGTLLAGRSGFKKCGCTSTTVCRVDATHSPEPDPKPHEYETLQNCVSLLAVATYSLRESMACDLPYR